MQFCCSLCYIFSSLVSLQTTFIIHSLGVCLSPLYF
uniref:Uncharacterized protein n=1 Tax=Rhizophora mucronata TaxID=61149 RepID=A0A2P2J4U8_RHIMU